MMERRPRTGFLLLAALAVAGCARDALVVERGQSLVEAGATVTAASRQLLDEVAATSREASIEVAIADRDCRWPDIRIATSPEATGICAAPDQPGVAFAVVDAATLRPTLTLIDAVTVYLASVDEIVSGEPDDGATALSNAYADVQNLVSISAGVAGQPAPKLLNDDQLAAATNLAQLIGDLRKEQEQARRLELLERQSPKMSETFERLDADLTRWTQLVLRSDLDTIDGVFQARATQLRKTATDAELRSFLTTWADLRDRSEAARALPVELDKALDALRQAHADYLRIVENRSLSDSDRRAMAQIARTRLSQALSVVAGAVRAFL